MHLVATEIIYCACCPSVDGKQHEAGEERRIKLSDIGSKTTLSNHNLPA